VRVDTAQERLLRSVRASFLLWEPEVAIVLFTESPAFLPKSWEGFFYSWGACVILLNVALRCSLEKSQGIQ